MMELNDETKTISTSNSKDLTSSQTGQELFEEAMRLSVSDRITAIQLMQKSADMNYPSALLRVCRFNEHNEEKRKKYTELLIPYQEWFMNQAQSGDAMAQHYMGLYYSIIEKDAEKCIEWYQSAADQNYAPAQNSLAGCYEKANDPKMAFYWSKRSADQGHPDSFINVGRSYQLGIGIEIDSEMAFQWYKKAADAGLRKAYQQVGMCYRNGEGVTKDINQFIYWTQKAAEEDVVAAQSILAFYYHRHSHEDKQNDSRAFRWCQRAAAQGDMKCENLLGSCYDEGFGTRQDLIEAFSWYLKSALHGHAEGQYNVGYCYYVGKGTKQDLNQAFFWFKKSAEGKHAKGIFYLGQCYEYGEGVEQSLEEAMRWYKKRKLIAAGRSLNRLKVVTQIEKCRKVE